MTRILQLVDAEGSLPSDAALPLDDELAEYFAGLAGLDAFAAFARLGAVPATGETLLDEAERRSLEDELGPLAARARERSLPAPPDWVGLEGGTDIRMAEELGWPGLLSFLQRFERLLHLAGRLRGELWVMEE